MPIKNKEEFEIYSERNNDPYGGACVKLAKKIMEWLDNEENFDANEMVSRADKEFNEGITGFMAGAIASIVYYFHTRGEEFKKSWDSKTNGDIVNGVKNPACFTINI